MEQGRQFTTYLKGRVTDALLRLAEEKEVSPYSLLATAAEEMLIREGVLKPPPKLDMSHREAKSEPEPEIVAPRGRRRRRGAH